MDEKEQINHWLNYLHDRLNRFENYFNYMISTLLVMVGLTGSAIATFSNDTFYAYLAGSIILAVGIICFLIIIAKPLSIQVEKKKATGMLIEKIINNEIQTSKQIKEEWNKIKEI